MKDEVCELGSDVHSVSVRGVEDLCGIALHVSRARR